MSIHAELVMGGVFTGALIGFFWHPVAAVLAMLTAALMSFGPRSPHDHSV